MRNSPVSGEALAFLHESMVTPCSLNGPMVKKRRLRLFGAKGSIPISPNPPEPSESQKGGYCTDPANGEDDVSSQGQLTKSGFHGLTTRGDDALFKMDICSLSSDDSRIDEVLVVPYIEDVARRQLLQSRSGKGLYSSELH